MRATCSRPATRMQSLPHTPTLLLTGCLDLARAAESGLKYPPRVSIVALMSGERAKSRSGERVEIPSESFHRSADERRAG